MCTKVKVLTALAVIYVLSFQGLAAGQNIAWAPMPDDATVEKQTRDAEGSIAKDTKKSNSDADDLDFLEKDIREIARTQVTAPALNTEVTSVMRTPTTVGRSPAAVFVITQEMIRRSGATEIPEVLRMVPGIDVARINTSQWSVTCRGFSGRFANKLLVQIDGRSIYDMMFSGVYWEAKQISLPFKEICTTAMRAVSTVKPCPACPTNAMSWAIPT